MDEDKIVTGESFSKDCGADDDEIPPENNPVTAGYRMTWSEHKIREIIQGIEYEIVELKAKLSHIDAKTSVAAKITGEIEFLLNDRNILQKNLDEFLMKLAEQEREGIYCVFWLCLCVFV